MDAAKRKQQHLWRSFGCAWRGIRRALAEERNMKLHAAAAALVCALGARLGLARWEWCVLLLAIAAVLTAELLNTALERQVDFVSPAYREEAGRIKDLAAGAVLAASVGAALLGALLLGDKLLK